MQPQRREVCVKNDEYKREQQHLAKQIKHGVVLRNDHILAFCAVQNRAHILKLFTLRCTCMNNSPKSMCHTYQLINTCWFYHHSTKLYIPENIASMLLSVLLQVCNTSNNANGNKQVLFFPSKTWYYGDNDSII